MTYHVIGPDGNRYGPADLAILNQWAAEGRVTPATMLEDASGARIAASSVPGLMFGHQMPGPTAPYGAYPGPHYHQPIGDTGDSDVTAAWVLGALSLVCGCCFISIVGLVMASKAKEKGNPNAQAALIFNIVILALTTIGVVGYVIIGMNDPLGRGFF